MVGFMVSWFHGWFHGWFHVDSLICASRSISLQELSLVHPGESAELLAAHADGNALKILRPFFGYSGYRASTGQKIAAVDKRNCGCDGRVPW